MIEPHRKLTAKEKPVWNRVIQSWPSDHWNDSDAVLLAHYCAYVVWMNEAIEAGEVNDLARLGPVLLKYAVALRLTPSSRYDPKTAFRAAQRGMENEASDNPLLGGSAWEHLN
jgi:hypothetical protein